MNTPKLRVISDIHGKYEKYFEIVRDCEFSIQIGDTGYHYEPLQGLSLNHKLFGGNHNCYKKYPDLVKEGRALGDYGFSSVGGVGFYFIRGAFSIDKLVRQKLEHKWGKTWFEEEQLSNEQFENAIDNYIDVKPTIMLTHDGPSVATKFITNDEILKSFGWEPSTFKTRTTQALDTCLKFHRPKLWIFGHFHKELDVTIGDTRFICLPELGYVDIDYKGNIL